MYYFVSTLYATTPSTPVPASAPEPEYELPDHVACLLCLQYEYICFEMMTAKTIFFSLPFRASMSQCSFEFASFECLCCVLASMCICTNVSQRVGSSVVLG